MTQYTARNEQITGASLSGSSGDANRTYTLTTSNAVAAMMKVMRGSASLQQGTDFTFSGTTNAITFISKTWDSNPISIDYLTTDTITLSGTVYCTTLQIARFAGMGVEVQMESLGAGNNIQDSYDLKNGNVLAGSYVLEYANVGSSASNDTAVMTETTHYTIDKNAGLILLTAAGVTLLGTDTLYVSYMYSPKHSDTLIATYLEPASREVDLRTSNYWGTTKTSYVYYDGYDSGYPQTDQPFGYQISPYPEFELPYKSVQTITSVHFLKFDGSVGSTASSDNYRIMTDDDGTEDSRLLVNQSIPNGKANVKVTFTHGYTSVPDLVQELTSLIGGIMSLVNISGGSYKDVTGYQLGRLHFQVGEQYINIANTITRMNDRINIILDSLGGNFGCV